MSDTAQQVKDKLDVADFIKQYVALAPAGRNLKGLCPFHKEKTPSFIVTPDRQIWHCFGCGVGGDIIAFLMRYENLEFIEALKILAEKAGVDMGKVGSGDQKQANALYEANKAAKEFYKEILRQAQGAKAVEYLKARGLKGETAKEFEIGFAPDSSDILTRHLTNKGYSVEIIEKSGLAIKTDHGTYRDRFWNRIMFPLHNSYGKCVGFTGRIAPWADKEGIGKYVNSPETPIFNKSKLLYGLEKTKKAIHDARTAILVEGQMDLIMAWQDGVKNIAATSGTAFTPAHLSTLKKLADNLVLIFDQDEPGRIATERTIDLAGGADFNVRVLEMPKDLNAKDPADVALAKPGLLSNLIAEATPAMNFYFLRYDVKSRSGDWKKNIRAVLSKMKGLASPVERANWLSRLAAESGIDEQHLTEEMEAIKASNAGNPEPIRDDFQNESDQSLSRKDLISRRIITLAMNNADLFKVAEAHFADLPADYLEIIKNNGRSGGGLTERLQSVSDFITLKSSVDQPLESGNAKDELYELFRQLKLENYKDRRRLLRERIDQAEKGGGEAPIELLSELNKITGEIRGLEKS